MTAGSRSGEWLKNENVLATAIVGVNLVGLVIAFVLLHHPAKARVIPIYIDTSGSFHEYAQVQAHRDFIDAGLEDVLSRINSSWQISIYTFDNEPDYSGFANPYNGRVDDPDAIATEIKSSGIWDYSNRPPGTKYSVIFKDMDAVCKQSSVKVFPIVITDGGVDATDYRRTQEAAHVLTGDPQFGGILFFPVNDPRSAQLLEVKLGSIFGQKLFVATPDDLPGQLSAFKKYQAATVD